jgi:hypothetical protein
MKKIAIICLLLLNTVVQAQDEIEWFKGVCKNNPFVIFNITEKQKMPIKKSNANYVLQPPNKKGGLHGNVSYFFNYRSFLDTPFQQQDLMQHTVQTRLDILLNKKIPISAFINHRNSNSPFFSNLTDITLQFKQHQLLEDKKRELLQDINTTTDVPFLTKSLQQISNGATIYTLDSTLQSQNLMQEANFGWLHKAIKDTLMKIANAYLVETKKIKQLETKTKQFNLDQLKTEQKESELQYKLEQEYLRKLFKDSLQNPRFDTLIKFENNKFWIETKKREVPEIDSSSFKKIAEVKEWQRKLDTAKQRITKLHNQYEKAKKTIVDSIATLKKEIHSIKDNNQLVDYLKLKNKWNAQTSKLEKFALAIQQIGIGRTWLDYSDLTVKNLSLNGLNAEFSSNKLYVAGAIGVVNYRFRDFILRDDFFRNSQQLQLLRLGYKKNNQQHLIATYYTGNKSVLNTQSLNTQQAIRRIHGFAVEYKFEISTNSLVTAEYARSETMPVANAKLFDFGDRTAEAWSIKINTKVLKYSTKIEAFYRRLGQDFQSFTLFTTQTAQDAWAIKIKQPFAKGKIQFDGGLRKNDFSNPLAINNVSTSAVFASVQLSMRIKKLPFVSIGFFPTSQLSMINNQTFIESQFNTLNAVMSHSYHSGSIQMNSNFLYNKFYNGGNDTGFVYFNATTLSFTQTILLNNFILHSTIAVTEQPQLHQKSVEFGINYNPKKKLSLTSSIKFISTIQQGSFSSYLIGVNYLINNQLQIQLQYNKSYLPSFNRVMMPLDIGRVTLSKDF